MTQTVVITGASAGIARATARLYGARGASVGLIARGQAGLDGAAKDVTEAGGQALAVPADVADYAQLEKAATELAGWPVAPGCSATPGATTTPATPNPAARRGYIARARGWSRWPEPGTEWHSWLRHRCPAGRGKPGPAGRPGLAVPDEKVRGSTS